MLLRVLLCALACRSFRNLHEGAVQTPKSSTTRSNAISFSSLSLPQLLQFRHRKAAHDSSSQARILAGDTAQGTCCDTGTAMPTSWVSHMRQSVHNKLRVSSCKKDAVPSNTDRTIISDPYSQPCSNGTTDRASERDKLTTCMPVWDRLCIHAP